MRNKNRVMVKVGTCAPIIPERIPAAIGRDLAQSLVPALLRDYADPEIQADYQRWKAERSAHNKKG